MSDQIQDYDVIVVGGGHAGGRLGALHFGLGDEDETEIRVIWPDQTVSEWRDIRAGAAYQVHRDGATLDIR